MVGNNETSVPTQSPTSMERSYVDKITNVEDILRFPQDIREIGGISPEKDGVYKVLDDFATPYLVNIRSREDGGRPGFDVIPGQSSCTVVTGMVVFTSFDRPESDPTKYVIMGRHNVDEEYELISEGAVNLPPGRNPVNWALVEGAPGVVYDRISIQNTKSYFQYRVYFPETRGNSDVFQVGGVRLPGFLCPEDYDGTRPST